MNCRERILASLDNQQPDRVPIFELLIDELSVVRLAKILVPEKAEVKGGKQGLAKKALKFLIYIV